MENINIIECEKEKDYELYCSTFSKVEKQAYDYIISWIDLCHMTNSVKYGEVETKKIVILYDNEAVGVWTYSLIKGRLRLKENTMLTNEHDYILPPIFTKECNLQNKVKENCIKKCIEYINLICKTNDIKEFKAAYNVEDMAFDFWNYYLLLGDVFSSKVVCARHLFYVDLNQMDLYNGFNQSSRRKIRKAEKELIPRIYESISWEEMDNYRAFHERIKGGATRAVDTWQKQMESINDGEAVLITVEGKNKQRLGGCIFYFTKYECYANSAAYDKSGNNDNLGHYVQFLGCRFAKDKGMKWLILGNCSFENDLPKPSPKELAISNFKRGLSTNIMVTNVISCSVKPCMEE